MASGFGAALHCKAGRLVEHDRRGVAIEHEMAQQPLILRADTARRWRRRRLGQRRHPDRLAGADRVTGPGAFAVDPDLAGAQQLFQPAVAQAGIVPPEPAVPELGRLHARPGR